MHFAYFYSKKEVTMPLLQVRDFPDEMYETLTATAKRENRSIAQQTVYFLKTSLNMENDSAKRRRARALSQTEELHLWLPPAAPSPEVILREDRDSSHSWEFKQI